MDSFIKEISLKFESHQLDASHFILPSRRAAQAFSKELFKNKDGSFLAPKIQSIEEFIETVSDTSIISNLETLFEFYKVYQEHTNPNQQEPIEKVYNWGQSIVQDFNEIDRYGINAEQFFGNLRAIKDLEHWSNSEVKTELIKNYIAFWEQLPKYYKALKIKLKSEHKAYQGMAYLEAADKIEDYLKKTNNQFYFIGFNALNSCEEKIFQWIVEHERGKIFWDIDQALLQNNSAGLFLRNYAKNWKIYQKEKLEASCHSFSESKTINLYGVSKKVGQAKLVGDLLSKLDLAQLDDTAIILGDENLLQPVLNSLPQHIKHVNVTMGLPLKSTSLSSFFEAIFKVRTLNESKIHHELLLEILTNPYIKEQYQEESLMVQNHLKTHNIVFQDKEEFFKKWNQLNSRFLDVLSLILNNNSCSVERFLENCLSLIEILKPNQGKNKLALEYFFGFKKLFIKLKNLLDRSELIQDFNVFYQIYLDILSKETLDFEGSPDKGLQIMGMLESRVLDFKTVIISSVNEGILPSGKSQNSFIPFDLKKAYQLPTYKEKDAVYAYHFFRLIQRADTCHFIYNNATSGVEKAEKSRFLSQLEVFKLPRHTLTNFAVVANADHSNNSLKVVHKTPGMIAKLKALLSYGISPSALTTYIRNPIDFYNRYILGINEQEELEEDISYRALGNVIHDCLEKLYQPYIGKPLQLKDVEEMLNSYPELIDQHLESQYQEDMLKTGKNLIDSEIAKEQVRRFLMMEKQTLKENNIQILELEKASEKILNLKGVDFKIKLKGTVDRVDKLNNQIRIIDYKTGKVEPKQLKVPENWEDFVNDYQYSKAFQVLFYALLKEEDLENGAEAGIVSFKNLKTDFMACKKSKSTLELKDLVQEFKIELETLILELLDPKIPFTEKTI